MHTAGRGQAQAHSISKETNRCQLYHHWRRGLFLDPRPTASCAQRLQGPAQQLPVGRCCRTRGVHGRKRVRVIATREANISMTARCRCKTGWRGWMKRSPSNGYGKNLPPSAGKVFRPRAARHREGQIGVKSEAMTTYEGSRAAAGGACRGAALMRRPLRAIVAAHKGTVVSCHVPASSGLTSGPFQRHPRAASGVPG
jgi:hypothetical protein